MRFASCGDAALTVELGATPNLLLTRSLAGLHDLLRRAPPPGFIESVPGLTSLTLLFDPDVTSRAALEQDVRRRIAGSNASSARAREWHFPVCYEGELAPDLAEVARACGLTERQAIAAHTSRSYVVYLLGFSPGFPYLGDIDAALALPRRAVPRPRVPAGSVAIATRYTAIYPQETPGGWHIIGRTPVRLFDLDANPPALIAPGDTVRFYAVAASEYERASTTPRPAA
ncbi:MAG TPA: 5-oxoprolinase subunit PxpB [Burkholderiales bacterium]|nr:5-oxoprolinase subunit PxpB [Burkholderiales bacterium]